MTTEWHTHPPKGDDTVTVATYVIAGVFAGAVLALAVVAGLVARVVLPTERK